MTNIIANELQLTEIKDLRDKYIDNDAVLDKVKALTLLPDNTHITTEMVSNYYEVPKGTIDSLIFEHNEELISDGYKILKGVDLKEFKGYLGNPIDLKFISTLAILPRRAILRIGMLLRDSHVAKQIRTYLLNIEENVSLEDKIQAIFQDNNYKLSLLDNQSIQIINQNNWLLSQNKELFCTVKDMTEQINNIENEINVMKSSFVFKQYTNPSYKFNDLIHKLGYKFNILSESTHFSNFYKILGNWIGEKIPSLKNTKQYVLNQYGIDIVENLVNGILIGRIVVNNKGNWIDLNGVFHNDIEFEKVKNEFDYCCAYCGKESDALFPEHIIPKSKNNSTDILYNIVPSCASCNKDKFDNNVKDWYLKQPFYDKTRFNRLGEHWNKYYVKYDN